MRTKTIDQIIDLNHFYEERDLNKAHLWLPPSPISSELKYKPTALNESLVAWQNHLTKSCQKLSDDVFKFMGAIEKVQRGISDIGEKKADYFEAEKLLRLGLVGVFATAVYKQRMQMRIPTRIICTGIYSMAAITITYCGNLSMIAMSGGTPFSKYLATQLVPFYHDHIVAPIARCWSILELNYHNVKEKYI